MHSEIQKGSILRKSLYPRLMRSENGYNDVVIVLFSNKSNGTVVYTSNPSRWCLGSHSTCWASELFQDFEDELILSN